MRRDVTLDKIEPLGWGGCMLLLGKFFFSPSSYWELLIVRAGCVCWVISELIIVSLIFSRWDTAALDDVLWMMLVRLFGFGRSVMIFGCLIRDCGS